MDLEFKLPPYHGWTPSIGTYCWWCGPSFSLGHWRVPSYPILYRVCVDGRLILPLVQWWCVLSFWVEYDWDWTCPSLFSPVGNLVSPLSLIQPWLPYFPGCKYIKWSTCPSTCPCTGTSPSTWLPSTRQQRPSFSQWLAAQVFFNDWRMTLNRCTISNASSCNPI